MNCKKCKKYIILHLSGEISDRDKIKMEKHLKDCPECMDFMEKTKELIKHLKIPEKQVPDGLMAEIQEKLKCTKQKSYFLLYILDLWEKNRQSLLKSSKILLPVLASILIIVNLPISIGKFSKTAPAPSIGTATQENIERISKENIQKTNNIKSTAQLSKNGIRPLYSEIEKFFLIPYSIKLKTAQRQLIWRELDTSTQDDQLLDTISQKINELNLDFIEITPEIKQIFLAMINRLEKIRNLQREKVIKQDSESVKLIVVDNSMLTKEEFLIIEEENKDRERLIELLVNQCMSKKKIPAFLKSSVERKARKIFAKVLNEVAGEV